MTLSRRNVIIGGVAVTWITLLLLTFLLVRSAQERQQAQSITSVTPTSSPLNRDATNEEKRNMLLNQSELDNAQRDYNNRVGSGSPTVKKRWNFTFELSPSLKGAGSPSPTQKKVLGVATTCNIDSAPSSLYVYDLKSHWSAEEAKSLAKEYSVDSASYSLPTSSSSFQYQFTSKDNSTFFNLSEASGIYKFHQASATPSAGMGPNALLDTANAFITAHKLNNKINPPVVDTLPNGSAVYTYSRVLDTNLNLVDENGVTSVMTSSLCNVPATQGMSQIQVEVRKDGKVANLANNTRTILGSYKATRLSLNDAVAEYQSSASQPVQPIVVPPTSTIDFGKVVIDSAVLAYYDLGENFGQELYVPFYITHGTIGSTQVVAFIPAVSATELLKKGLIHTTPLVGSAQSQQQGVLGFATPTPKMLPPPPATGPISGPGCPGSLVDYRVECSANGVTVCRGMFSANSANDPMGACSSGCKEKAGTVTSSSSKSPCDSFLDQQNIPAADRQIYNRMLPGSGSVSNGTQLSCSVNACPC